MVSDNLLYPDSFIIDTSTFTSPFLDPDWMFIGQTDINNCFCNSGTTSYCLPIANQDWKDLHAAFKSLIAPYIQDIHVDFYNRYDRWIFDPNSTLTTSLLEQFSISVQNFQRIYIRDGSYSDCMDKISPFSQRKFINSDFNFTAKVDEFPYYFYLQGDAAMTR